MPPRLAPHLSSLRGGEQCRTSIYLFPSFSFSLSLFFANFFLLSCLLPSLRFLRRWPCQPPLLRVARSVSLRIELMHVSDPRFTGDFKSIHDSPVLCFNLNTLRLIGLLRSSEKYEHLSVKCLSWHSFILFFLLELNDIILLHKANTFRLSNSKYSRQNKELSRLKEFLRVCRLSSLARYQ